MATLTTLPNDGFGCFPDVPTRSLCGKQATHSAWWATVSCIRCAPATVQVTATVGANYGQTLMCLCETLHHATIHHISATGEQFSQSVKPYPSSGLSMMGMPWHLPQPGSASVVFERMRNHALSLPHPCLACLGQGMHWTFGTCTCRPEPTAWSQVPAPESSTPTLACQPAREASWWI